jgi:hypothetical protein
MMDIFSQRPFRAIELTAAFQVIPPMPTMLGSMGEDLFRTVRSRSRVIGITKRNGMYRLIPTSPIGAPPVELEKTGGEIRLFSTRRLAKGSTLYAEELQGILQEPLYDAVASMQAELADRAAKIRDDMELTFEHQRFGALMGKVIDADGTTVLDDWFANWEQPIPAAFNFHLDVATTNLRLVCDAIYEAMLLASQTYGGGWINGVSQVHALAGSAFFTALVTHPMVERTYLNYQAAADLRGDIGGDEFTFGNIVWHRYRGTPNGDFSIPSNESRFFPVGAGDTFQRVQAPAEFAPFINQPGQDTYSMTIPDRDRDAWTRFEMYSYPLFVCTQPAMLQSGVAS